MNTSPMYLSSYRLTTEDCHRLRLYDTYSSHRAVYDLFERTRAEGDQSGSGILYVDKGKRGVIREIIILSDRHPRQPARGMLATKTVPPAWFNCSGYRFEIVVNPVVRNAENRKLEPFRNEEDIRAWFFSKMQAWGFEALKDALQVANIHADRFKKAEGVVTLAKATVSGWLAVSDKERFVKSARLGIGRGRAFGCGLLQLVPAALSETL